ncbi:glycosyltransferase [Roseovarius sp. EL26]|uniref:glycosyltransferase family 2 protein n=1 Tax=Roseovarius sp. EL26 TaxID=2126672 RepID=UPI000EA22FB7|nr:glycosyltransferase [Roseovarius sp. EL26]
MSDLVSVIIPARNEAATITRVVSTLMQMDWVDEIVVVDNGSEDQTGDLAAKAGATVVFEATPGMGEAVRAGLKAARNDWVMKLDADLDKFQTDLFARMVEARAPGVGLVKGAWNDLRDNMPMTRLLVGPAMRQLFPRMPDLRAPNTGIYLVNRSLIAHHEIIGNYAADLDVMVRVHAAGAGIAEVDIGRLENNPRDVGHYNAMAETILAFFLHLHAHDIGKELMVVADDGVQVTHHCLGRIAAHARVGGQVDIYLGADGLAADILRDVLEPYPTARLHPLAQLTQHLTTQVRMPAQIIAPNGSSVAATEAASSAAVHDIDLLQMPIDLSRFVADTGYALAGGAVIKQGALKRLGHPTAEAPANAREVFQSLATKVQHR